MYNIYVSTDSNEAKELVKRIHPKIADIQFRDIGILEGNIISDIIRKQKGFAFNPMSTVEFPEAFNESNMTNIALSLQSYGLFVVHNHPKKGYRRFDPPNYALRDFFVKRSLEKKNSFGYTAVSPDPSSCLLAYSNKHNTIIDFFNAL